MVNPYLTWIISRPSMTSCGTSLTLNIVSVMAISRGERTCSFLLCAGNNTVLTPARSAPISFSLIPPTAVTRPRKEISPYRGF